MTSQSDPVPADSPALPEGVGRTALGVAGVRAFESERPDRLFDDPYAHLFLRAAGVPDGFRRPPSEARVAMARHIVLRTRFFDDYLQQAAADGLRQVVLLAAGLDARAFRLPWPAGTRLFELDLPESLAFKEGVLRRAGARPRCARTVLPVDLREDWATAVAGAGFDPAEPTAWLIEGLLIYLGKEAAAALLETVGRLSAPGSRLALVHSGMRETVRLSREDAGMSAATSLWRGGLGADPALWLGHRGWDIRPYGTAELAAAYGTARPEVAGAGTTFLIATRRADA